MNAAENCVENPTGDRSFAAPPPRTIGRNGPGVKPKILKLHFGETKPNQSPKRHHYYPNLAKLSPPLFPLLPSPLSRYEVFLPASRSHEQKPPRNPEPVQSRRSARESLDDSRAMVSRHARTRIGARGRLRKKLAESRPPPSSSRKRRA